MTKQMQQTEVKAKTPVVAPGKAKAPSKAKGAPKTESKAKVKPYAAMLTAALAGEFGKNVQAYFKTALAYHKKQGTAFPRAQWASHAVMPAGDAIAMLAKVGANQAARITKDAPSMRLFDQMIVESFAAGKVA